MQWNAISNAADVIKNYPTKRTMQSEAQCGNFNWATEYNKDTAPNDWADSEKAVAIKFGTSKIKPSLPANSINTFFFANPVSVNQKNAATNASEISVHSNGNSVRFVIPTTDFFT